MEAAGLIKAGLTGFGFSGETFENVIEENTNSDYGSADVLVTEGEEFVDIEWIVGGLSRRQETMKMKIR